MSGTSKDNNGRPVRWELTPPPRSDETLASMVLRASVENVHGSTAPILQGLSQSTLSLASLPAAPGIGDGRLAKVLRLPNEIVTRATHARIEGSPAAFPMMNFFGAEIPEWYRYSSFRRVSPLSLITGNYDRAIHSLWPIQYAPSTSDQITETCLNPACGARLTWYRVKSVAHCAVCGCDQRDFRTNMAPECDREPLAFMAALVDPNRDNENILSIMPDRFRGNSSGSLFMLGVLVSRMEYRLEQKVLAGEPHRSSRKLCADGLAAGGRALLNWNDYVDSVIQRERELGHPLRNSSRILKELHSLRKSGSAGEKLFWEATEKFTDHFCSSQNYAEGSRARRVGDGWASTRDAASILGVDNRRIAELRKKGLLVPIETYGERRKCDIYSLDGVLQIRRALDESATLRELNSSFGIPSAVAGDLIRAGLFEVEDNPAVPFLRAGTRVTRAGVVEIIEKIRSKAMPIDGSGREWISIMTALDWIGGRPKPWARLVSEILTSDEPVAYSGFGDRFDFRALRIHESMVSRIVLIAGAPETAVADHSWTSSRCTEEEASTYLNCSVPRVSALATAGFINRESSSRRRKICSDSVQQFGSRYISKREIRAKGFDPKLIEQLLSCKASPGKIILGVFYNRRSFENLNLTGMQQSRNFYRFHTGRVGNPLKYAFSELSDAEWNVIRAKVQPQVLRGGEDVARAAFNGMLWYAITGKSFKQMPPQYGNRVSVAQRFFTMNRKLQWEPIFQELRRDRVIS